MLGWSHKGDFRTFPLPIFHHLGLNFPYNAPSTNHELPKLSKLTVTMVECKLHSVTRASQHCVTGDCMRNKTPWSANTKYHYIFPSFQWYETKEDLPLMYSCMFWCGFIGLVDPFALLCDLCNSTLSTRRRFAAWKLVQSLLFSTRGKFSSSPQLGKYFLARYPTHVAGYEHFLAPCSKTPPFGGRP